MQFRNNIAGIMCAERNTGVSKDWYARGFLSVEITE
jgi:hypothetical protein